MSKLLDHAARELSAAGFGPDATEPYNKALGEAVMGLMKVFSDQNHSGFSAGMTVALFEKVARYEVISPLTGAGDEWIEVAEEGGHPLYQNKRCSRVFKCNGVAYDIDGKIFREPDGIVYTNKDSRVTLTFPCTPKSEYVDVPYSESRADKPPGGWGSLN